jgi:hypothetical protein
MDNRIANDMISSGMIPSGEKNKEDLSRTQYGSVPSPSKLMDAYKSMYEHHQKDKDGNTIPHEGEELNEGKIPAGLQAYLDKKKGKKEDKKDMKEEVDKFDIVFNHFISEGYSKKEAYAKMANLTEEQLDEFLQALAPLAKGMMAGAVKLGAKAKPLATFAAKQGKALGKVDTIAKAKPMATGGFKEPLKKVTQGSLDLKGKGGMSPDTPSSVATGRMSPRRADTKSGNLVGDEIKRQATATVVNKAMSGGGGGQKNRTGGRSNTQYQQQSLNLSHDLFDIVKGQLLDEGLTEEEIKDIMLTLTPDEIMKEMNQGPSTPVRIDDVEKGDGTKTKRVMHNFGAGRKGQIRPKPGFKMNPLTAQLEKEEYKGSGTPEQQAAMKAQIEVSKKVNRYGGKTPSGTTAVDAKKGIEDVRKSM